VIRPSTLDSISESFVAEICRRVAENQRVRRSLPVWGRLNVDRQLPFLCVYRQPQGREDPGTCRFVQGEAVYLTASGAPQFQESLAHLVREIARTLAAVFDSFLILEVWSGSGSLLGEPTDPMEPKPWFRIHASKAKGMSSTVDRLEGRLRDITILKRPAEVEWVASEEPSPPGLPPLVPPGDARKLGVKTLGLEVGPVYRSPANSDLFPLVLRTLHRHLSRAFKQTFFEFMKTQTSQTPSHYYALGRRAMVKAVWEVDRKLADFSNAYDFLLYLTPTNTETAWTEFRRSRYRREPEFLYRPLPIEPALRKRVLYKIPVERIEDPVVGQIFREKQQEQDRKITMLSDRNTQRFLHGSVQLYGGVDDEIFELAKSILDGIPFRSREESKGGMLSASEFADLARQEIGKYHAEYPPFEAAVEVRKDFAGLMVSRGNLLVGENTQVPVSRADALLQHEVGTHILTYVNGRAQPFRQLYTGLAGYDELQEGLAVLAEYLAAGMSGPRMRTIAARAFAVRRLLEGAGFVEAFRELVRTYGFERKAAFAAIARIYRGGGFTKDAVYLKGLVRLLEYLKRGGKIETLFVGKIHSKHVPLVNELTWRKVLVPPPVQPHYMAREEAAGKLEGLRNGLSVLDLVERRQ